LGDVPAAITYYEESAEFLSKPPAKDLEVLFNFSVTIITLKFHMLIYLLHLSAAGSYSLCFTK
jgi:hypothetical protein